MAKYKVTYTVDVYVDDVQNENEATIVADYDVNHMDVAEHATVSVSLICE